MTSQAFVCAIPTPQKLQSSYLGIGDGRYTAPSQRIRGLGASYRLKLTLASYEHQAYLASALVGTRPDATVSA